MKKRGTAIVKFCLLIGLAAGLVTTPVWAGDTINGGPPPSGEAMAVDLLLVRPVGVASTVIGTGFFILSLPFSILGGNVDDAGRNLVLKPAKSTFVRPLGEFE